MCAFRYHDSSERELLEALAHTIGERSGGVDTSKCPSPGELRELAKGACGSPTRRVELVEHLADCNHCIQILKSVRRGRVFRQRALAVSASLIVVLAAIWIWSRWQTEQNRAGIVATIDLRAATPTRGGEKPSVLQPVTVDRHTAQLRIILPLGSDGNYEAEILPRGSNQSMLARASGMTQVEDQSVVLHLSVDLSRIAPGDYSLALKKSGGEWEYYSLKVE